MIVQAACMANLYNWATVAVWFTTTYGLYNETTIINETPCMTVIHTTNIFAVWHDLLHVPKSKTNGHNLNLAKLLEF